MNFSNLFSNWKKKEIVDYQSDKPLYDKEWVTYWEIQICIKKLEEVFNKTKKNLFTDLVNQQIIHTFNEIRNEKDTEKVLSKSLVWELKEIRHCILWNEYSIWWMIFNDNATVEIDLSGSNFEWEIDFHWDTETFLNVKTIILSGCKNVKSLKNLPINVDTIIAHWAWMEELDLTDLEVLQKLDVYSCKKLKKIKNIPNTLKYFYAHLSWLEWEIVLRWLNALETIDLREVGKIWNVSKSFYVTAIPKNIRKFDASNSLISGKLEFHACNYLEYINVGNCINVLDIPLIPDSVIEFFAYNTEFYDTVLRFKKTSKVKKIDMMWSKKIRSFSNLPYWLISLNIENSELAERINCEDCVDIEEVKIKWCQYITEIYIPNGKSYCIDHDVWNVIIHEKWRSELGKETIIEVWWIEISDNTKEFNIESSDFLWVLDLKKLTKLEILMLPYCNAITSVINMSKSIKRIIAYESGLESEFDLLWLDNLESLLLNKCLKLKLLKNIPLSLEFLKAHDSGLTKISFSPQHQIKNLHLESCEDLINVSDLPNSLEEIYVSNTKIEELDCFNCVYIRKIFALNCPELQVIYVPIWKRNIVSCNNNNIRIEEVEH